MDYLEADYPCVGVCMNDADGYCIGCGRPPWPVPNSVSNPTPPASDSTTSRPGETAPMDDEPATSDNIGGRTTTGVPS
jgi:hypothetical protein